MRGFIDARECFAAVEIGWCAGMAPPTHLHNMDGTDMHVTVEDAIANFLDRVAAQKPGARQQIAIRCFEYPMSLLMPVTRETRLTSMFGVELRPSRLEGYCEPIMATSELFSDAFGAALEELALVFEAQYGVLLETHEDQTFLRPDIPVQPSPVRKT